jgi:hypothetical protein
MKIEPYKKSQVKYPNRHVVYLPDNLSMRILRMAYQNNTTESLVLRSIIKQHFKNKIKKS